MGNFPTIRFFLSFLFFLVYTKTSYSQYPTTCSSLSGRSNGNGQANTCPNVNGTPYASNFTGSYAVVPAGAKTADITFRFTGASTSLKPYAITRIYSTPAGGTTTQIGSLSGPASVPIVSGSDALVTYCIYGVNLPSAGTLSFELTNPETGVVNAYCSYDASCNTNCGTVASPVVLLPLGLSHFSLKQVSNAVNLQWDNGDDLDIKGFDIEKSTDGTSYSKIGFVAYRNATGVNKSTYSFTDNDINSTSKHYYRIKVLYNTGSFLYSSIELLQVNGVNEKINIMSDGKVVTIKRQLNSALLFSVKVYNTQGQTILSGTSGLSQYSIRNLRPGHYYIEVQTDNAVKYRKAVEIF
jgi:hypothetical protein